MKTGPVALEQLNRLARTWKQGEHVLVSGATGSGKTALGRYLDQIRINAGGHVVVFVCKPRTDPTIEQDYKSFKRWKTWKRSPSKHDNAVLLWPDTSKAKTLKEIREIQRDVFSDALDRLANIGLWTIDIDEGLYMTSPEFMGFSQEIAMLHAVGRSSKLTMITKMQRPSHVPLILYGSASHAFIGRTRERVDTKRLSEIAGRASASELGDRIASQGRHDFLWVPVAPDWEPETINLKI